MSYSKIKYFCHPEQMPFFFTDQLTSTVAHLADKLSENTQVSIYPDAVIKPNGLPTGICCASPANETVLLPFVLRDPGCGYLVFKLRFTEKPPAGWESLLAEVLTHFVENKTLSKAARPAQSLDLNALVTQGAYALAEQSTEIEKFHDAVFPLGTETLPFAEYELAWLHDGFLDVTNTVEIRGLHSTHCHSEQLSAYGLEKDDLIGFIHTGSEAFANVLAKRFVYDIAEYADINGLFTLEEIKKGIFGVPATTPLGQTYSTWLRAAMNYAIANRYAVYLAIKQEIETHLPCQITLMNDNTHAGLFSKTIDGKQFDHVIRGVQRLSQGLTLLAGQRESIAAMVVAGAKANYYQNLICHGTSYHIRKDYDYSAQFAQQDIDIYQDLAQNAFYNTESQLQECIPYTYNLLQQLDYFEKTGLCETAVMLNPLVNVHGNLLKAKESQLRALGEFV